MAEGSKGGGGGVAIVVALIGVVGVLGAAYINSQPKSQTHHQSSSNQTAQTPPVTQPQPWLTPQYMGALVPNTSYSGADYTHLQLGNPAACASTCLAQAQCKSMTYDGNAGTCWLKGSVPPGLYGSNFTSAVKQGG